MEIKLKQDVGDWNRLSKGIQTEFLASSYFGNNNLPGGPNTTYSFTGTSSMAESKTISVDKMRGWSAGFSLSLSSEFKIPLIGGVKTEFSANAQWSGSTTDGTAITESNTKDLTYTMGTPVRGILDTHPSK
jgi:hypothetical protein